MATFGSTSYDDPGEREPDWDGATWYGGSSGTYWTINPKEYADPRKHGPEYLARAQRLATAEAQARRGGGAPIAETDDRPSPAEPSPTGGPSGEASTASEAGRSADGGARSSGGATARSGTPGARAGTPRRSAGPPAVPDEASAEAGAAGAADEPLMPSDALSPSSPARASGPAAAAGDPRGAAASAAGSSTAPAFEPSGAASDAAVATPSPWARASRDTGESAFGRARLPPPDDPSSDVGDATADQPPSRLLSRRTLVALLAWPPIGLALAGLFGELSGCTRYAATCADSGGLAPWAIQVPVLLAFLLMPAAARIGAVGSIALVIVAIPAGLTLAVAGGNRVPGTASALLLVICAIAYVVGVAGALSGRIPVPTWLDASG